MFHFSQNSLLEKGGNSLLSREYRIVLNFFPPAPFHCFSTHMEVKPLPRGNYLINHRLLVFHSSASMNNILGKFPPILLRHKHREP